MSSHEHLEPWRPPDLDASERHDRGVIVAPAPMGSGAAPVAMADWAPAALEERGLVAPRRPRSERERAYELGFTDGRAEGRAEGQSHVEPALRALGGLFARLEHAESEFGRERERNLVALALVVARKLVQQEMHVRPDTLQALVTRALELQPAGVPAEVHLNSEDLEALAPGIEKLALEGRSPAAQWIGDPSLPRGSFVIESPARIVDGRVDSALRQLYERLDRD